MGKRSDKPRHWLVLWQKTGCETVATMKVIDAWQSYNCPRREAEKTMLSMENQTRYIAEYGEGRVQLVEGGKSYFL